MSRRCDVAIIGAGPYALSAVAFLREGGAEARVFRRVMGFWETMPNGMFIRSFRTASNMADPSGELTLELYEQAVGKAGQSPLPLDDFIAYGRWFQEQAVPGRRPSPAAAAWLRPRLADVEICLGKRVVSAAAANGGVRLQLRDGGERSADHVLLGTGYRVDLSRYSFLEPRLTSAIRTTGGYPVLSRFFESSVEGLYFLGAIAAATAGPGMRFVSHTGPVAAAVRRNIVGKKAMR